MVPSPVDHGCHTWSRTPVSEHLHGGPSGAHTLIDTWRMLSLSDDLFIRDCLSRVTAAFWWWVCVWAEALGLLYPRGTVTSSVPMLRRVSPITKCQQLRCAAEAMLAHHMSFVGAHGARQLCCSGHKGGIILTRITHMLYVCQYCKAQVKMTAHNAQPSNPEWAQQARRTCNIYILIAPMCILSAAVAIRN